MKSSLSNTVDEDEDGDNNNDGDDDVKNCTNNSNIDGRIILFIVYQRQGSLIIEGIVSK